MTTHPRRMQLLDLAMDHGIAPARCPRCGEENSWRYGYDDGTDPNYVGYQHGCGKIVGLTRGTIERRARSGRW